MIVENPRGAEGECWSLVGVACDGYLREPPPGAGEARWREDTSLEIKFSESRLVCTFIHVTFICQVFSDGLGSGLLELGPGLGYFFPSLRSPTELTTLVTEPPGPAVFA